MAFSENERCTECGAPLTNGVCGNCAPGGRPLDKAARRRLVAAAAHEKDLWEEHALARKLRARPHENLRSAPNGRPRPDRPPAP